MLSRQSCLAGQTPPHRRRHMVFRISLQFQASSTPTRGESIIANFLSPPPSAAEISAGIICSSLPILVALFRDQAAARKSRLPSSLRSLFSRFFSRNSQQSLIEDRNRSSETLRPSMRDASMKTSKDYMQLSETGTMSAKSNSRASY